MSLELKGVQIKYGDFVAIENASFDVKDGEFFTLLGPSGCGKSTVLRSIAGFNNPSKGEIFLNDNMINNLAVESREVGMVFQSYALFPTMTVFDNIAYGLKIKKLSKEEINSRVNELIELVELDESQLAKNVTELSGGQQQRVAIARALAQRPNLVLFDEPLSNLDAKLRQQLRIELKKIQRETGMTAIYVTHDQDEALQMSDRIAVFNMGTIEQIGTPEEIYNESATEFVCNFIGDPNKLGEEMVTMINKRSVEARLDLKDNHYLREEKIKLSPNPSHHKDIKFDAEIIYKMFNGAFTIYHCQIADTELQLIHKNDGKTIDNQENELALYINPEDILSYEVKDSGNAR